MTHNTDYSHKGEDPLNLSSLGVGRSKKERKERKQTWQAGRQTACKRLSNSPEFTTQASNRMTPEFRQKKAVSKSQATN
jgi:hypothetical protein